MRMSWMKVWRNMEGNGSGVDGGAMRGGLGSAWSEDGGGGYVAGSLFRLGGGIARGGVRQKDCGEEENEHSSDAREDAEWERVVKRQHIRGFARLMPTDINCVSGY
jgi:hypothetical protein